MQQPSPDRAGGSENQRPPGVITLNNVQIMRPGVPIPQKSVATVTPRVIVGNPRPIPGPSTMSQEMLQNMAGPSLGQPQGQAQGQGHVLVKSDGRYQLVRVGAGSLMPRPANLPAMGGMQGPVQSEVMVPMSIISAQGVQTIQPQQMGQQVGQQVGQQMGQQMGQQVGQQMGQQMGQQIGQQMGQMGQQMGQQMCQQMGQQMGQQMVQQMMPQQYPRMPQQMQMQLPQMQMAQQASGTMHLMQTPQTGFPQGAPQRMIKAPESSKDKCRNFLANLLELSSKEPPSVERNVRQLIQELIDGAVEAADFCSRLERLLNANSQPCLVGFLMKSLPMLRQSMAQQEMVIPGVRPPPLRVAYPHPPQHAPPHAPQHAPPHAPQHAPPHAPQQAPHPAPAPMHYGPMSMPVENIPIQRKVEMRKQDLAAAVHLAMFEDKAADDDINDVAAMGGVNLMEESQRFLADTHNIGSQIRSCSDDRTTEPAVRARLRDFCLERELTEPAAEVAQYFSLALCERLKAILTRITCDAIHRQAMECKTDDRYEVSQDVKGQLKFLEELDRVEKRRREESEREMLLRAAKSRSKTEDPEQAKLKAKAKEMQRAEMEEVRQREANLTALQAIGPRKKARAEPAPAPQAGPSSAPAAARRSRLLRITLRDMLHFLENDRVYAHSPILYKAYLKS